MNLDDDIGRYELLLLHISLSYIRAFLPIKSEHLSSPLAPNLLILTLLGDPELKNSGPSQDFLQGGLLQGCETA